MSGKREIILSVKNFSAGFERDGSVLRAVDDISFNLALIGEKSGAPISGWVAFNDHVAGIYRYCDGS